MFGHNSSVLLFVAGFVDLDLDDFKLHLLFEFPRLVVGVFQIAGSVPFEALHLHLFTQI